MENLLPFLVSSVRSAETTEFLHLELLGVLARILRRRVVLALARRAIEMDDAAHLSPNPWLKSLVAAGRKNDPARWQTPIAAGTCETPRWSPGRGSNP